MLKVMAFIGVMGASTLGCTIGPEMTMDGMDVQGVSNSLYWDGTRWVYNHNGGDPTAISVDTDGVQQLTSGPHEVSGFVFPLVNDAGESMGAVKVFMTDQGQKSIGSLSIYNPYNGQMIVEMTDFNRDTTVGVEKYNERVLSVMETQGFITAQEKEVAVKALETTADISSALAEAGVRAIIKP